MLGEAESLDVRTLDRFSESGGADFEITIAGIFTQCIDD
jgi:hypothetical protein